MEDILASIRRILSEDEAPEAKPTSSTAATPPGVLMLDPSMMVPEGVVPEGVVPEGIVSEGEATPVGALETPERHAEADREPHQTKDEMIDKAMNEPASDPKHQEPPHLEPASPAPAARSEAGARDQPHFAEPTSSLVAPEAAAAAASSVGALLRSLATERGVTVSRGGPSLEDIVREELRPLLKEWLDSHLPPLVERLVRAEIERVVGRAAP